MLELSHDVPRPAYLGGGQDPHSAHGSGAPDWESYHERMGYIFTLLRAHQCDSSMFQLPPGTPPF